MPVKVRCSSCDKAFAVPDAARGKAVKCPQCESRVAVPATDKEQSAKEQPAAVKKAVADKAKKKPAAKVEKQKAADSEDFLASLDLAKAEDTNARICHKCGFDMHELDEEETECPKCGYDVESGGLGLKARKRQMKGPDPADFFPGLAKEAWSFVVKNQMLAWRTDAYIFVSGLISLFCAFCYLSLSQIPPRGFFALCFFVSFMVIPGWLWHLDTEVIKLTLERKDKFKRLNFDFFLASSKGAMFVAWFVAVAVPLMALPVGICWYLVNYSGQPSWVLAVGVGVGMIPVLFMLPVVMAHMTMPITMPAWMFWKVAQLSLRSAGGLAVWMMWLLISNIPTIGGAATIAAVWGNDLTSIVQTMESNAAITRKRDELEKAPKGGGKKNAPAPPAPETAGTPVDVNFRPVIGPLIILSLMCLPIGFIGLFNMRITGMFTFFFKDKLELKDKAKEYKYVAKERPSEDDDDKPRTWAQDGADGGAAGGVCVILGAIGGMLFGSFTEFGVSTGIAVGVFSGSSLGVIVGLFFMLGVVFPFKPTEEYRKGFIAGMGSLVILLVTLVLGLTGTVSLIFVGAPPDPFPPAKQQAAPMMQPGMSAPGEANSMPGSSAPTDPAAAHAPK